MLEKRQFEKIVMYRRLYCMTGNTNISSIAKFQITFMFSTESHVPELNLVTLPNKDTCLLPGVNYQRNSISVTLCESVRVPTVYSILFILIN